MERKEGSGGIKGNDYGCHWATVTTLELPPALDFQDYSAVNLHRPTGTVAITSQENSQIWVGKLSGGGDGSFDPKTASFNDPNGRVYDFPRNDNCEVWKPGWCSVNAVRSKEGGRGVTDLLTSKHPLSLRVFCVLRFRSSTATLRAWRGWRAAAGPRTTTAATMTAATAARLPR